MTSKWNLVPEHADVAEGLAERRPGPGRRVRFLAVTPPATTRGATNRKPVPRSGPGVPAGVSAEPRCRRR